MAEQTDISGFTAGETKLLMSILKNLKGDLNCDWAAVAAQLGYKDAGVVKTRWGQIRRKKNIGGATPTAGVTKKGVAKVTSGKGNKRARSEDEGEAASPGASDEGATPAKSKGKGVGRKSKSAKVEEAEEDEGMDDGFGATTVKDEVEEFDGENGAAVETEV